MCFRNTKERLIAQVNKNGPTPATPGKELLERAKEFTRQSTGYEPDDDDPNTLMIAAEFAKVLEDERKRVADGMEPAPREALSAWMISHSYATGHGDTFEDMLRELVQQVEARWQITHMREITGNPDIDGPTEGQKWVECDEGVCGAVAWRREKGES
jgi:hypothetical protein